MRTPGEQLAAHIREAADAAADRNESIWAVRLDVHQGRLFCQRGTQLAALAAVLYADRYGFTINDTDRAEIACVDIDPPRELFACAESMMPGLMGVLRANNVHGAYRESGTEREYRF